MAELLKRYEITLVSFAIALYFIICYIKLFNFECDSFMGILCFFSILGILHLVYTIYLHVFKPLCIKKLHAREMAKKKKEKIQISISNFSALTQEEKEILWQVFFNHNSRFLQYKINDLIQNNYLEVVQIMFKGHLQEPIVKLNEQVRQYLQKEFDVSIESRLKQLTDNEKILFNMFIDESEGEYIHPILEDETYRCLYELSDKKLINLTYKKIQLIEFFSLMDCAKNHFKSFSDKAIKREIVKIDLSRVKCAKNSGSGASGGVRKI